MLKQGIIYIILSIVVVLFAKTLHLALVYLHICYDWLNLQISPIFANTLIGIGMQKVLVLTLLPILLISIPAGAYRLIKGQTMPHLFFSAWFLWLVIVLSIVLTR